MKLILQYIKRHLGIFLISNLFLAMEVMADLLQPTLMAHIVDRGVKGADLGAILRCGAVMAVIAAAGGLGAVMRNLFSSRTSQAIAQELRGDLYRKVQTLSLENVDRLQPASIITRITNDVSQVQEFINGCMRVVVKAPLTCLGAVILLVIQTPRQLPMILAVLGVTAVWIAVNMKLGYPKFSVLQKKLDRLNAVSREFLSSIRVVKAFQAEGRETGKFETASAQLAKAGVSTMQVSAVFSPLINLTVNLGIVVLLWFSQRQDSSHIGQLMASVNYMTQMLVTLNQVSKILNTAVRAMASSARIGEILDERPTQRPAQTPLRHQFSGEVTFADVSFSYAGAGREALRHVSFQAKAGETVGIIGPTGAGKSTLISLVSRLYDATGGAVLLDGQDVTQIEEKNLRSAVAIAPQKALLFSGTILENLRWGREDATEEQLHQAAQIACAHDFILASAQGYDTLLGQGGVNLSGGQRQRLSLARALVLRPRILILDDCTSALDAQTESAVLDGLRQQAQDTTVLLISQRISTVMRAHRILCLEDGAVQGFGTHQELMAHCGTYQAIYASQIGGETDGR